MKNQLTELLQHISTASLSVRAAKDFTERTGQDCKEVANEYLGEAITALKVALKKAEAMQNVYKSRDFKIFIDGNVFTGRNVRVAFDQGQTDEETTDFLEISHMSGFRDDTPRKLWVESRGEIMVESMEHRRDGSLKITMEK